MEEVSIHYLPAFKSTSEEFYCNILLKLSKNPKALILGFVTT